MNIFLLVFLIISIYASTEEQEIPPNNLKTSLRITIITDCAPPKIGGVEILLDRLTNELEKKGHIVTLISPKDFYSIRIPYSNHHLSLTWPSTVTKLIEESNPDAVHVVATGILGLFTRSYGKSHKYTASYHLSAPEYWQQNLHIPLSLGYEIFKWFLAPAVKTLVPSVSLRARLIEKGFKNTVLWSHGVDLETFTTSPSTPAPLSLPNKIGSAFLYVGRVVVNKNLEAFLELDLPGIKWVVGDGPQLEPLKRKYGSTNICWIGEISSRQELAHFYANADVFVLPSKAETFGLVLLEAMACGCPVAAYPVTGPIDILGDSPVGALDEHLGKACLKALTIDRKAVRNFAEQFTWEKTAGQFVKNLHNLKEAPYAKP